MEFFEFDESFSANRYVMQIEDGFGRWTAYDGNNAETTSGRIPGTNNVQSYNRFVQQAKKAGCKQVHF